MGKKRTGISLSIIEVISIITELRGITENPYDKDLNVNVFTTPQLMGIDEVLSELKEKEELFRGSFKKTHKMSDTLDEFVKDSENPKFKKDKKKLESQLKELDEEFRKEAKTVKVFIKSKLKQEWFDNAKMSMNGFLTIKKLF